MNGKPYHHGNLRAALVAAGLEILEEDGLAGLSLRAIAARAGVSHAAPRNHFRNLGELHTAIAAEGFRRHAAAMRAGIDAIADRPARMRAAMEGYVRFAAENPELFALMFSVLHIDHTDPELGLAASESYAVLSDIATGLNWDKAEAPDAQLRAETMLWSLVHGYAHLRASGLLDPPGRSCDGPLEIGEIMPDFGYLDKDRQDRK